MSGNEDSYQHSATHTNKLPVSTTNLTDISKMAKKSTKPGRKPKKQSALDPSTYTLPHKDATVKANLQTPHSVPVICGNMEALFFPETLQIEVKVKGKRTRMTPREFEKLAGFEEIEKWKSAILVQTVDSSYIPIDAWLEERLQPTSRIPETQPTSGMPQTQLPSEERVLTKTTMLTRMYEAVGSREMPFGVSDPEVPALKIQRRKANKEHRRMVDYRTMSERQFEDFLHEAQTKSVLFRIPRKRRGKKDGVEEGAFEWKVETPCPAVVGSFGRKRRKYYNPTVNRIPLERPNLQDNIDNLLLEVLETAQSIPFRNFHLSLTELYHQVEEFGGYEQVVLEKLWSKVALNLDLTESGFVDQETEQWIETVYTQYLLNLYRHLKLSTEQLP